MADLYIRSADPTDYNSWARMVLDYDPDVKFQTYNTWAKFFNSEATCLLAVKDKQVVGFLHYLVHDFCFKTGSVYYLSDLYVMPEFRRLGIARTLLQHLLDTVRKIKSSRVYWVTEFDNPARHLYDEVGGHADFIRYHIDL